MNSKQLSGVVGFLAGLMLSLNAPAFTVVDLNFDSNLILDDAMSPVPATETLYVFPSSPPPVPPVYFTDQPVKEIYGEQYLTPYSPPPGTGGGNMAVVGQGTGGQPIWFDKLVTITPEDVPFADGPPITFDFTVVNASFYDFTDYHFEFYDAGGENPLSISDLGILGWDVAGGGPGVVWNSSVDGNVLSFFDGFLANGGLFNELDIGFLIEPSASILNVGDSFMVRQVATVVPIPAAVFLFSSGIGLLGFLGWRRKQ